MTDNLVETLQAQNSERNVLFTAIEELQTPALIQAFCLQYLQTLKTRHNSDRAADLARGNIIFAIACYGQAVSSQWRSALGQTIDVPT